MASLWCFDSLRLPVAREQKSGGKDKVETCIYIYGRYRGNKYRAFIHYITRTRDGNLGRLLRLPFATVATRDVRSVNEEKERTRYPSSRVKIRAALLASAM